MSYLFHTQLISIWKKAVSLYQEGKTDAASFPIENDLPLLACWGMNKMDVFDYAEDWCLHNEPDLVTFILVHYERKSYFQEVQGGRNSQKRLDPSTLPSKTDEIEGIPWLPRILPKARAKLRGELPEEVMYGCGGDRQFFSSTNVHPAELLRATRLFQDNDQAICQWVIDRKNSFSPDS